MLDLEMAEVDRDPSFRGKFEQNRESAEPVGLPPGFVSYEGKFVRLEPGGKSTGTEILPANVDSFEMTASFLGSVS